MKRISDRKRRAVFELFLYGWAPRDLGRLFRLTKREVEQIIRDHANGRR